MNHTCCDLHLIHRCGNLHILLHGSKGEGGPLVVGHYQHRLLNHLTFYTPTVAEVGR